MRFCKLHRKRLFPSCEKRGRRTGCRLCLKPKKRDYKKEYQRYGKAKAEHDKILKRSWYYKNTKKALRKSRQWARKHPLKRRAICNAWYARNRIAQCKRQRIRYWKNIASTRKGSRYHSLKRYWRHPVKMRQYNRELYRRNIEARRAYARKWHKKQYWKDPDKERKRRKIARMRNPEKHRITSGWYTFKKRYGLNLTDGKEFYICLRMARQERKQLTRKWSAGAISDTELRQRLLQLVSKMQRRLSTKMQQA